MGRPERPVDPRGGVVAEFAEGLRALRRGAGNPTYRELARRAHYAATTLAHAARGTEFPSLAVVLAYVRACGGDVGAWEKRWHTATAEITPPARLERAEEMAVEPGESPYVGLAAYGPNDVEWFCGRERLVATLTERVAAQRFVAVVGASGAGKSSVLRAGLLPAMSARGWPAAVITPGAHPMAEYLAVRAVGSELSAGMGASGVLVVDQFEEVFTLCHDPAERDRFITALLDNAGDAGGVRVVIGLRADFYAHCARYARLVEILQDAQVLVGPMSRPELEEAITRPAVRAGLMVEKALVTAVVRDASERAGALPFVSHAMWETWKRRRGAGLFLADYQEIGGVAGAIAQTADRVYDSMNEEQQRIAREILVRLTALGEDTADTRRRVPREELLDRPDADAVGTVLARLAAARLVTMGANAVEIAHEALIQSWPRLRSWLTNDREIVLAHRRLTEAAAEWDHHGNDESLLYRGARLDSWNDRWTEQFTHTERAFLTASRHVAAREQRQRRRRVRLAISGLSATTVVVTVLAVIALTVATRAENARVLAVSGRLVSDARAQLPLDPELALLLAREAYATAPNPDTEAVLRQAVAASHLRASVPLPEDAVANPYGISYWLTDIAFSSDGRRLAVSLGDFRVRAWNWDDVYSGISNPLVLRTKNQSSDVAFTSHGRLVVGAREGGLGVPDFADADGQEMDLLEVIVDGIATSADGQRIAIGTSQSIEIWNGKRTKRLEELRLPTDGSTPARLTFSADGKKLARHDRASGSGSIQIWDLDKGAAPRTVSLPGSTGPNKDSAEDGFDADFSPDGDHVTSVDKNGTIRVRSVTGTSPSFTVGTHDGGVRAFSYSPDGHLILTGGVDGTVRVWNAHQSATPVTLHRHNGEVSAAAFNPDSKTVVSIGTDHILKVSDVETVDDLTVLRGHRGPVLTVASAPDGRIASGGQDGTVRIWDTTGHQAPRVLSGPRWPVNQVMFSPDGRHLAVVYKHKTNAVLVWDTHTWNEPSQLPTNFGLQSRMAFSADGKQIASTTYGLLKVFTLSAGHWQEKTWYRPFDELRTGPSDVAWSPNGDHLATGGANNKAAGGAITLWTTPLRGDPILLPVRHQPGTLTFSPNGTHLANGDIDGNARLWNLADPTTPTLLRGHQGAVTDVDFTPEGRHLITTSNDNTIRIWEVKNPNHPLQLDGFRAPPRATTTTDDDRIVTAHDDGTIQLWRCPACGPMSDVLTKSRQHITRELTTEERRAFHLPED